MKRKAAPRLQRGDEIRVIAPSQSLSIISEQTRSIANDRFKELGLKVSFSAHAEEIDDFTSSPIAARVDDIHAAFKDPQVKAVLTAIGGFNANQLLDRLDWDLIRNNPKIFCGFSDITALSNAIYTKTGLITYCGPHYSSFGMRHGFDYTLESFVATAMDDSEIIATTSREWSDDQWYRDQENRTFIRNEGWLAIQPGEAEGTIIGGNVSTLLLLSDTSYMPKYEDMLLFIEEDEESQIHHFDRMLTALSQQPWFANVRGVVIGRFQNASKVTHSLLRQMVQNNGRLKGLPVVADVNFGHTTPILTIPIGGRGRITSGDTPSITILEH